MIVMVEFGMIGFAFVLVGLVLLLNAVSTLVYYNQLSKLPPPTRRYRDRVREPKVT